MLHDWWRRALLLPTPLTQPQDFSPVTCLCRRNGNTTLYRIFLNFSPLNHTFCTFHPLTTVLPPPPGPWHFPTLSLAPAPSEVMGRVGRATVLPCTSTSSPGGAVEVRWQRDGLLLDLPARGHRLLPNGSLEVEGGEGTYQCMVTMQGVGTLLSTPTRVRAAGPPSPHVPNGPV